MAWSQLNLTICHLSTPYAYMAFWRGLHCRVIEEALGRSRTRLYGAPGASGGRSEIGPPDLANSLAPRPIAYRRQIVFTIFCHGRALRQSRSETSRKSGVSSVPCKKPHKTPETYGRRRSPRAVQTMT